MMTQITNTTQLEIQEIVAAQREYFKSGATLPYEFRKQQLTEGENHG